MNAWDIILEVWPVPVVIIALTVITFLRILSFYRRDEVETHDLARKVYHKRKAYERELKRQRLQLMGLDENLIDEVDDYGQQVEMDDNDEPVLVV